MANVNENGLLKAKKDFNLDGIQVLQNGKTVNNILYKANLYSTSNLSSTDLYELIQDLLMGRACTLYQTNRVKSNVRVWLESINELENVINKQNEIKKELAKQRVLMSAIKKHGCKSSYIEKMNEKIEQGKLNVCIRDKVNQDFDLNTKSPQALVNQYLNDMQYKLEVTYNFEKDDYIYKIVKQPETVFIPLDKVLAWYYSNYDMTSKTWLENTFDNVVWDNSYQANNKIFSKGVLKMVVETWVEYYNLNKQVTTDELDKIAKYIGLAGIGV